MTDTCDTVMRDLGDSQFDHRYRIEGTDKGAVEKARDKFLTRWGLAYFARGGSVTEVDGGKFSCDVSRAKKC